MFYNRATSVASSVVTAVLFTVATGTSASASVTTIPWTQQTVFELAEDDSYAAEWMGPSSGWTIIGGSATRIYAGSAGVFETDASGNIWVYNGTPYSWTEIGGPGAEFVEGGGHLYGIGPDYNYVAEWMGLSTGWEIIGGPAQDIYAGPDGMIALSPSLDAYLYEGTPGSWTEIGGQATDYAVGNAIYRVDLAGDDVEQWTGGTTWEQIFHDYDEVQSISAGGAGLYATDETAADQLKYNGTPYSWTKIAGSGLGDPLPAAISLTSLYGVTINASGGASSVVLYSGSGTTWTTIGGPADMYLAAGD